MLAVLKQLFAAPFGTVLRSNKRFFDGGPVQRFCELHGGAGVLEEPPAQSWAPSQNGVRSGRREPLQKDQANMFARHRLLQAAEGDVSATAADSGGGLASAQSPLRTTRCNRHQLNWGAPQLRQGATSMPHRCLLRLTDAQGTFFSTVTDSVPEEGASGWDASRRQKAPLGSSWERLASRPTDARSFCVAAKRQTDPRIQGP